MSERAIAKSKDCLRRRIFNCLEKFPEAKVIIDRACTDAEEDWQNEEDHPVTLDMLSLKRMISLDLELANRFS